jgi:hypothetical protein
MMKGARRWRQVLWLSVPLAMPGCGGGSSSDGTPAVPASRSMTVTWDAPEANADGTAMTDLAGYRVLIGTASGQYGRSYTVAATGPLALTVPDLPPATYYVVVKAYDHSDNESEATDELVGVVQ